MISTAATIGAAIILHRLDQRAPGASDEAAGSTGAERTGAEIDADRIDPAQRKAMLAELEAQL